MSSIERDDLVKTFVTNGSDQSFAIWVGRRHTNRRSQCVNAAALALDAVCRSPYNSAFSSWVDIDFMPQNQ
jgi:hypothetical protein